MLMIVLPFKPPVIKRRLSWGGVGVVVEVEVVVVVVVVVEVVVVEVPGIFMMIKIKRN